MSFVNESTKFHSVEEKLRAETEDMSRKGKQASGKGMAVNDGDRVSHGTFTPKRRQTNWRAPLRKKGPIWSALVGRREAEAVQRMGEGKKGGGPVMEGWTNSSSSEWMCYPDPLSASGTRKNQLQQNSKKLGQSCEGPAPALGEGKIHRTATSWARGRADWVSKGPGSCKTQPDSAKRQWQKKSMATVLEGARGTWASLLISERQSSFRGKAAWNICDLPLPPQSSIGPREGGEEGLWGTDAFPADLWWGFREK